MFLRPGSEAMSTETATPSLVNSFADNRSPILDPKVVSAVRRQYANNNGTPRGRIMDVHGVRRPFVEVKLPRDIRVNILGDQRIPFAGNQHLSVAKCSGDTITLRAGTIVRMTDKIVQLVASSKDAASHDKNHVEIFSDRLYRPDSDSWINFKDCPGYAPSGLLCTTDMTQTACLGTNAAELRQIVSSDIEAGQLASGKFIETQKAA